MDPSTSPELVQQELSSVEADPLDFVSIQLKGLRFIGIYPPQNSSRNKTIAYYLYTASIMFIYVFAIMIQFKALQEFWGADFMTVSGILYEEFSVSFPFVIACAIILNQKKLHSLTTEMTSIYDKFQDLFNFEIKDKLIVTEAARKSKQLSQAMIGLNFLGTSYWILVPFLTWLTRSEDISAYMSPAVTVGNVTKQYPWGFFVGQTWLPQDAEQMPLYFLMYSVHITIIIHLGTNAAAFPLLFCGVMEYTASLFKLLIIRLEEIDDFLTEGEFHEDNTDLLGIDDSTIFREIYEQIMNESKETDGGVDPVNYLSYCIKYHQEILNLCDLAQDAFSVVLFIALGLYVANMTFGAFISTELPLDEMSKFLLPTSSCTSCLLLVCWYGQKITDQSAAVERTVCGSKWYHGSPIIKKNLIPIIVRSQSPVVIKALGWYPLNLEGFSTVANKIYGYFTILKGMKGE